MVSATHAFFADVTAPMRDLNDLIPSGTGWLLNTAQGINEQGPITGSGTIGGRTHAFLLTPIPEPGTARRGEMYTRLYTIFWKTGSTCITWNVHAGGCNPSRMPQFQL